MVLFYKHVLLSDSYMQLNLFNYIFQVPYSKLHPLSSEFYSPLVQTVACQLSLENADVKDDHVWDIEAYNAFTRIVENKVLTAVVKDCNKHVAIIDIKQDNGDSLVKHLLSIKKVRIYQMVPLIFMVEKNTLKLLTTFIYKYTKEKQQLTEIQRKINTIMLVTI